jgi:hypothetical protein
VDSVPAVNAATPGGAAGFEAVCEGLATRYGSDPLVELKTPYATATGFFQGFRYTSGVLLSPIAKWRGDLRVLRLEDDLLVCCVKFSL